MEIKKAVDLDLSKEMDAEGVSGSSRQVMSISPTDIDPDPDAMTIDAKDVMLTPRVLDQSAYDSLSDALGAQIEKASKADLRPGNGPTTGSAICGSTD